LFYHTGVLETLKRYNTLSGRLSLFLANAQNLIKSAQVLGTTEAIAKGITISFLD
jgi:hypothetical protein